MISKRQEMEREYRKQQIIEGALTVFKEKGIEGSTMDEIAREADFGKATLYYYFGSKEDIFRELLESGWRTIWEEIEPDIQAKNTPKKTFIKLLNRIGELVIEDPVRYEFLFAAPQMISTLEGKNTWKVYQDRMYKVFHGLLEEGMAEGEFPVMPSDLMMRAIGGLFHGLFFLGQGKKQVSKKSMESLITTFMGTVGSS